ncbi:MAG: hypothetical protein ABSE56_19865 [Bryobacteraceae bacterium]
MQARFYDRLRCRLEECNAILRDLARASVIALSLLLLIPALDLAAQPQGLGPLDTDHAV